MPPLTRRTEPARTVQIDLPSMITLDLPGRRERGSIRVFPAGKPPRLRFRPGSFIRYQSRLWEIMFAYRLADIPTKWR